MICIGKTKCTSEKGLLASYETLKSTGEIKLIMKFHMCFCTIALKFEIYFLSFPWKIVFGVISGNFSYL